MVAVSGYKFLNVITPFPEGSGGQILNTNFQSIANLLESGVIHDATRGFTQPISGVLPVNGYELARLADITAQQVGSGLPYWNTARLQNIYVGTSSPPSGSLIKYDGSQWQPSGTSLVFLSEVFADKTPQLGGPLDLTYSSVIYNYAGSGLFLGGDHSKAYRDALGQGFATSCGLMSIGDNINYIRYLGIPGYGGNVTGVFNVDLQFIDVTYPSGNLIDNVILSNKRNTVIGGYYNRVSQPNDWFSADSVHFDQNVIIGGYNNYITASGYGNFFTLGVVGNNIILGGHDNLFNGGVSNIALATTNICLSGSTEYLHNLYYTGNSPLTLHKKSTTHGIYNIENVNGGFNSVEFFLWGGNPNTYSVFTQDSGVIVDFWGSRRGVAIDTRFPFTGGMNRNSLSSYELFCTLSASGQDGAIHTTAWSPIHLKMSKEGAYVNWFGVVEWLDNPTVLQSGFMGIENEENYAVNSLRESGWYPLDSSYVYWYPSKYNNGLSGLCTIYSERDDYIDNYYNDNYINRTNEYEVITNGFWENDRIKGYTHHQGKRLIIQFRLYDYGWSGLRASVWARGMEIKNRILGTVLY